ncbi:FMN-dependent NADH-azoreductase [Bradyrhizobium ivorense]|uniref:FMN-dependent NADH-azoreductase n=1 Tax=Bradyrhizobium ivorense TaxID=2511166 RepID=A0A508TKL1_9BRAD|nr:NAD(P)H-dependent oxidoreductase [Bradyrhizobium ivorense]VIO74835.1 FMN-dependent NADH-azoreductase [Bradyrhizobium ivorense]
MLIQVVHSHPLEDSYDHALFQTIVGTLRRRHEVIATDLDRERFSPVMTEAERRSYFQGPHAEEAVSRLIGDLRRADGIIFCFPHWWFSMPAMLKGYFDRVWAPGTAFAHDLAGGRIKPLLTNIRLFGVVTTYGSPWWLTRIVMQDPGRKVLFRALKPMCGAGAQSFYMAHYDMDRSTPASRTAFIERVRARVSAL